MQIFNVKLQFWIFAHLLFVLHSTCAESASELDTTLQLMWCHIIQQRITKKPVRAHIKLNVDS